MPEMKICPSCNRELELSATYFFRSKREKDGFDYRCKECNGNSFSKPKPIAKDGHKICSKCELELPNDSFGSSKKNTDGLQGQCKECRSKYLKQWNTDNKETKAQKDKLRYEKNKESVLKTVHAYQVKNADAIAKRKALHYIENRVSIQAQHKVYQASHVEETRKYHKQYRFENKEVISIRNKAYSKSRPEENRVNYQNRRARMKKLLHTFTAPQWEDAKMHFDNKCCFCEKETKLTMEHLVSLVKGGSFTRDNIVPSCKPCNSSKNDSEWTEWFRRQPTYTLAKEQKILKYLGYKNGIQQLSLV